jgi:hypothetical protein
VAVALAQVGQEHACMPGIRGLSLVVVKGAWSRAGDVTFVTSVPANFRANVWGAPVVVLNPGGAVEIFPSSKFCVSLFAWHFIHCHSWIHLCKSISANN